MSLLLPCAPTLQLPPSSRSFLRTLVAQGLPILAQKEPLVEAGCALASGLLSNDVSGSPGVRMANVRTLILRAEGALARAVATLGSVDPGTLFPAAAASPVSTTQQLSPPSAMRQSLSPVQGLQSFSPSSPFATSPSSAGLSGSPSPRTPFSSHPSDFGTPEIPTQSNQQQHPFHAAQSSPIIDARLPQLRVTVAADTLLALAQPVINSRSHLSTNFSPSTSNTSPTQVTAARRTALHAIQSLTLLAHLAYAQSRPIEGHKHLGAAVRLALACNLHRLPASAPNIRGAVDAELEAARETWWMVFCTERAWAGVGLGVEGGGFDTVLDDGGVLTPFGVIGISKNEWGGLEVTRPVGLSGHRSIQQPSDIMIGATESLESLSAKTYALAARVSQLSARWTATHDPALTSNISHIIHILEYLVYSPPTIRPASGSPQSPVPSTTEMQLVALSLLSRLRQVMGDTSSALSSARQFAQLLATLNEGALTMLHGSLGRHLLEIGRVLCEVPGTEADAEFVRNAGAVCTTRMPYLSGACGATST